MSAFHALSGCGDSCTLFVRLKMVGWRHGRWRRRPASRRSHHHDWGRRRWRRGDVGCCVGFGCVHHVGRLIAHAFGQDAADAAHDEQHNVIEHLGVGLINRSHLFDWLGDKGHRVQQRKGDKRKNERHHDDNKRPNSDVYLICTESCIVAGQELEQDFLQFSSPR